MSKNRLSTVNVDELERDKTQVVRSILVWYVSQFMEILESLEMHTNGFSKCIKNECKIQYSIFQFFHYFVPRKYFSFK
jgi:hypothetical protein